MKASPELPRHRGQPPGSSQRLPQPALARAWWLLLLATAALLLPRASAADRDHPHVNRVTPATCPGLVGGRCSPACQLNLCRSLARVYAISNNASDPWDNEDGWADTATRSCEQLAAARPRGGPPLYCDWWGITCCDGELLEAGNCTTLGAVYAIELPINNLNVSMADGHLVDAMTRIHGCGLTVLNLEANNIAGPISPAWGNLNHLSVFNFGNCWIEGTIPSALRNMTDLEFLNLSNNYINGTLPAWLDDLAALRVLNLGTSSGHNDDTDGLTGLHGRLPAQLGNLTHLRELNLEANSITGTLPPELCHGDNSTLLLLNLRANRLSGNATSLERCGSLVQLDISANNFSGVLPASSDWDELTTYRAAQNGFVGRLPKRLLKSARILEHLDVSDNQLEGGIPNTITLLSGLKTLLLGRNSFTGTMTEDIYYLPSLMHLDISNNQFVGTIPPAIGSCFSLQDVNWGHNPGLTGVLPPQLGLLTNLRVTQLPDTHMSCAGITRPYGVTTNNSCTDPDRCTTPAWFGNDTAVERCPRERQLPCFLRFSDYPVPRDDNSSMRCKYIIRKQPGDAKAACSGEGDFLLGDQAEVLLDSPPGALEQQWIVPPSYFQYQACECLLGFKPQWEANETVLRCLPDDSTSARNTYILAAVGAFAAIVVAAAAAFAWRQYLQTRPRWVRERELNGKRKRGAPVVTKSGEKVIVSVVTTDVKDYSDLTRRFPELMNKAMGGHNNILRKACHTHAGYILDQEGDSWTVAFHDAADAVAFSLQVQQSLAHKVWGMRLAAGVDALPDLQDLSSMRDGVFSTRFSSLPQNSVASTGGPGLASRDSSDAFEPQPPAAGQRAGPPGCTSFGSHIELPSRDSRRMGVSFSSVIERSDHGSSFSSSRHSGPAGDLVQKTGLSPPDPTRAA